MTGFNEELIVKYLDHSISESEEVILLEWIKSSEENLEVFMACKKIYTYRKIRNFSSPVVLDQALQKFNNLTKAHQNKQKSDLLLRISKYAAILIFAVAFPYLIWLAVHNPKVKYEAIVVNSSEPVRQIMLPDGTKVWINNESTFTYPQTFGKKNREVTIIGEAFFEVKTDSLHPFIVKTGTMQVKVYGTSFNVNSNTRDSTVQTTLVTGKISINDINGNNITMLSPGHLASFNTGDRKVEIKKVNTEIYTLWRKGLIVFDKASLREITDKISDLYNVHVTINSQSKLENRINFVFRKTQPLNTVMEMLEFVAPIKYKIYDKEIYIKPLK